MALRKRFIVTDLYIYKNLTWFVQIHALISLTISNLHAIGMSVVEHAIFVTEDFAYFIFSMCRNVARFFVLRITSDLMLLEILFCEPNYSVNK